MKPDLGVAGLEQLRIWRARRLLALHVDTPPLRVGHHQMRIHLALEPESGARLVQQVGFSFRAALLAKAPAELRSAEFKISLPGHFGPAPSPNIGLRQIIT